MKRLLILIVVLASLVAVAHARTTLEQCHRAAHDNYPLIKQYGLIEKTATFTVDNIKKAWLPQASVAAQLTWQSGVAAWPEQMQTMMEQFGVNAKGLSKTQGRVGLDVSQTLYDGGTTRATVLVAEAQAQVDRVQSDVAMYAITPRVNDMYFSLMLIEEQIKLNLELQMLLSSNENKLSSMFEHGTAAECDYKTVMAERLNAAQQHKILLSQKRVLAEALSLFCGIEVDTLSSPDELEAECRTNGPWDAANNRRPELSLANAQISLANAQEKLLDAAVKPKISLFGTAYFGYPGYNMFKDMLKRDPSLNAMLGIKASWNIGSLYTRKNDKALLQMKREQAMLSRETFEFNNRIEELHHARMAELYRNIVSDDEAIIQLRAIVRKAAESRLDHGIIDVQALVKEIKNENDAKINRSIHKVEMLKQLYGLKYTTNN